MPFVRELILSVLDGDAAGPNESIDTPLGLGGAEWCKWFFSTRTWQQRHGQDDGSTATDNDGAQRSTENIGAWILGRNTFGPPRGPWQDNCWKG